MPQGLPAAEKDYLKALALDPDFALAWSGLAETYSYMIEWGLGAPAELSNKARSAADHALLLDQDLAEAHTARGTIAMTVDWDWKRAEQELKRAIELRPSYAYAVHWYAHCLEYTGRVKEGFAKMQEAQALDPLLIMFEWDLSASYVWNRQYDKALEYSLRIAKEHSHDPGSAYGVALSYYLLGKKEAGLAAGRRLAEFPEGGILYSQGPRALMEARWGDPAEAKRQIQVIEATANKDHIGAEIMAMYYLEKHDLDHAFAWLDKAVADHADGLLYLKVDPLYDAARADPRFPALLKRVGFE
jgi:tetratricopeptide (TPR) repeat protein